jgi:hypothetical protein
MLEKPTVRRNEQRSRLSCPFFSIYRIGDRFLTLHLLETRIPWLLQLRPSLALLNDLTIRKDINMTCKKLSVLIQEPCPASFLILSIRIQLWQVDANRSLSLFATSTGIFNSPSRSYELFGFPYTNLSAPHSAALHFPSQGTASDHEHVRESSPMRLWRPLFPRQSSSRSFPQ